MSPGPGGAAALLAAIAQLRQGAGDRYGQPLIEVRQTPTGLSGWVALPSQAEQLQELASQLWPEAKLLVLVLARRRARVALCPEGQPLDIWRRPIVPDDPRAPERTTQLLPGDPPAELVAARGENFLVRAPGEALGWIPRSARMSLRRITPGEGSGLEALGWSPRSVLDTALGLEGLPYVWGATGGSGVDCSGLVWRSFLAAGVLLPRNSRAQRALGERVSRPQIQAGDIICAISRGPRKTSHVGLALSPAEVIHACSELKAVLREPLAEFQRRYRVLTVRRVPGRRSAGR